MISLEEQKLQNYHVYPFEKVHKEYEQEKLIHIILAVNHTPS